MMLNNVPDKARARFTIIYDLRAFLNYYQLGTGS